MKESQDLNRLSCYNSGREPFGLCHLYRCHNQPGINLFRNLFKMEARVTLRTSGYCKLNVQFELNWDGCAKVDRGEGGEG